MLKCDIWREPAPMLIKGKFKGIICDNGYFRKAIKNSKGDYLFSEYGEGVNPLVLIGTTDAIINFLHINAAVSICNQIKKLPFIYFGVGLYIHKERYNGHFPFQEGIVKFIDRSSGMIPFGNNWTYVGGVPSTLKGIHENIHSINVKSGSSSAL